MKERLKEPLGVPHIDLIERGKEFLAVLDLRKTRLDAHWPQGLFERKCVCLTIFEVELHRCGVTE
jgi:hypothetical protein